ncbi:MAG: T9SS type A sorting domain-containing protein [Chitinophagales bacterium]
MSKIKLVKQNFDFVALRSGVFIVVLFSLFAFAIPLQAQNPFTEEIQLLYQEWKDNPDYVREKTRGELVKPWFPKENQNYKKTILPTKINRRENVEIITPPQIIPGLFDTLVISLKMNKSSQFHFESQRYGNGLHNLNQLFEYAKYSYGLTASSSQYQEFSAFAHMCKANELLVNGELVQTSVDGPSDPNGFFAWPVVQCGNYANKIATLMMLYRQYVGKSPIEDYKIVTYLDHTVMEYYDSELQKWVMVDGDQGTTGFGVLRPDGIPASLSEMQEHPDWIAEGTIPYTPIGTPDYMSIVNPPGEVYANFWISQFDNPENIREDIEPDFWNPEMEYNYILPEGAELLVKYIYSNFYTDPFKIDSLGMGDCALAWQPPYDSVAMFNCIKEYAERTGKTISDDRIHLAIDNNTISQNPTWAVHPIFLAYSYIEVKLPQTVVQKISNGLETLEVPLVLHHFKPQNDNVSFVINNTAFEGPYSYRFYWPAGTFGEPHNNPQEIDELSVQYGAMMNVAPEVGNLTLGFQFNPRAIRNTDSNIGVVTDYGDISITQYITGNSETVTSVFDLILAQETSFKFFLDESDDLLTVFKEGTDIQEIEIYNSLGKKCYVNKKMKPVHEANISNFAKGAYFIHVIDENGKKEVKSFVKK